MVNFEKNTYIKSNASLYFTDKETGERIPANSGEISNEYAGRRVEIEYIFSKGFKTIRNTMEHIIEPGKYIEIQVDGTGSEISDVTASYLEENAERRRLEQIEREIASVDIITIENPGRPFTPVTMLYTGLYTDANPIDELIYSLRKVARENQIDAIVGFKITTMPDVHGGGIELNGKGGQSTKTTGHWLAYGTGVRFTD